MNVTSLFPQKPSILPYLQAASVRLLLSAAPEAAMVPDAVGHLPCHYAANSRDCPAGFEALRLLIEAAPASLLAHIASDQGDCRCTVRWRQQTRRQCS